MEAKVLRLIELSGELEISRNVTDSQHSLGGWYGFSWLSGYVYGNDPQDVITEMLLEAEHNKWCRLPIVQIDQHNGYIERRMKRMKVRTK